MINALDVEKDKFISIIKDHQNLIFKICYSYCTDSEGRKDLEQEILIQLWKAFPKFDGRVKISTWMYRIALNTAISCYRSDCKRPHQKVLSIDESIISLSSFEMETEQNDQIRMLYQFIERLNELDKAIILLYLDDKQYAEISDITGITVTNVATKISRIKKSLKDQFKQTINA